jgi:aryl-alcohol dehydrogenase-like predicted oxidoreductase
MEATMNAMDDTVPHPDLYRVPFMSDEWHGMPYRRAGQSGLRTSVIGIGTWKFGFPETGDGARVDEKTAYAIFDRAIELGVTFWDTANRYNDGSGNAERVIGRWLKANPDQRRNVIVCTKAYGAVDGSTPNHSRLSRQNILDSVYASLRRMQLDYVDMLYFHLYDQETPIEESLAAIEDLVQRDLVRYFAVSNFTVDQLKLYKAVEQRLSPRCRAVAVQNRLDILRGEQADKQGVLRYCAGNGVAFVPYSPLAGGLLSDRYLDLGKVGQGDRLFDEGTLSKVAEQAIVARQQALAALAHNWDMELSQLALAYMLTLPGMGTLIPSASTVKQLESNARAGTITLSAEQRNQVHAIVGF